MFCSSDIKYEVDNEKRIVTCTISGIKKDAIETLLKGFARANLNMCLDGELYCRKYTLPDTLTAKAKYDPDDPNPYDPERGKEIARRRLYAKYNSYYSEALMNLYTQVFGEVQGTIIGAVATTERRQINFEYYSSYCIYQNHLHKDEE